jgi:hypothetical protein
MKIMDDNVWEYPFGDLDEDDEIFFHGPAKPERGESQIQHLAAGTPFQTR